MTDQDIKCPLFVGFEAIDLDAQSGDIKLLFRGQDDRRYHLRLAHGLVPIVTTSLVGLARQSWEAGADPQARQEAVQSLTVTAVHPYTTPEGEPGLLLVLEGQLVFPLVLPEGAVTGLRSALDAAVAAGKSPGTDSPH